jgi:GNAT superfamily N-acetyltransferase
MGLINRSATVHDLERLLPLLDQQFIYSRNRRLSLALRFPTVFTPNNCENIFLCEEQGIILSALAFRHFDWHENGQKWHGAMLGAVYTDPRRRGQGLASQLLQWSMQIMHQLDFAVLWTAQPGFYRRLGWVATDNGLFAESLDGSGILEQASLALNTDEAVCYRIPIAEADLVQLEQIRSEQGQPMIVRQAQHYRHLPIPAESLEVICSGSGSISDISAYALLGQTESSTVMYEMAGNPAYFAPIFSDVCKNFPHIMVNDCKGSPSQLWLARHSHLRWQEKPLAMWLSPSGKLSAKHFAHWYIPYFDRI